MRSQIATRLETGFQGLSSLLSPSHPSAQLNAAGTANGGSHAIGSMPIPTPNSSIGGGSTPPPQKPSFQRQSASQVGFLQDLDYPYRHLIASSALLVSQILELAASCSDPVVLVIILLSVYHTARHEAGVTF